MCLYFYDVTHCASKFTQRVRRIFSFAQSGVDELIIDQTYFVYQLIFGVICVTYSFILQLISVTQEILRGGWQTSHPKMYIFFYFKLNKKWIFFYHSINHYQDSPDVLFHRKSRDILYLSSKVRSRYDGQARELKSARVCSY